MTDQEEIIVYDALRSIMDNSVTLAAVVRADGSSGAAQAFKNGVYAPAVRLQILLGNEALERGRIRHEQMDRDAEQYCQQHIPAHAPIPLDHTPPAS